jgi:hypothetical protein
MDTKQPQRRSSFSFTIRELLLLMVGVGALLALGGMLYKQYRIPFEPTVFLDTEQDMSEYAADWEKEIQQICHTLGQSETPRVMTTVTTATGSTFARRAVYFRFPLSAGKRKAFADAFEAVIENRISRAGCSLSGGTNGYGANESRMRNYSNGPIGGSC